MNSLYFDIEYNPKTRSIFQQWLYISNDLYLRVNGSKHKTKISYPIISLKEAHQNDRRTQANQNSLIKPQNP